MSPRLATVTVLVLMLVFVVGCERTDEIGAPTAREAATLFVEGVLEGDVETVSRVYGSEVDEQQLATWRTDVFLVDEELEDVQPVLGTSYESAEAASLLLEEVRARDVHLYADGNELNGVIVWVFRDGDWYVEHCEAIP